MVAKVLRAIRETATYVPSCRSGAEAIDFEVDGLCLALGDDGGDVIEDDLGRV